MYTIFFKHSASCAQIATAKRPSRLKLDSLGRVKLLRQRLFPISCQSFYLPHCQFPGSLFFHAASWLVSPGSPVVLVPAMVRGPPESEGGDKDGLLSHFYRGHNNILRTFPPFTEFVQWRKELLCFSPALKLFGCLCDVHVY